MSNVGTADAKERPIEKSDGKTDNIEEIKENKENKETSKVLLFLRPVGEASALRKTRYKLDGSKAILEVEKFLKKTLGTRSFGRRK